MKKMIFTVIFLAILLQSKPQVYLHPQGMAYYKEGAAFLENENYREAEKSLSNALNTLKDENVYMKRGIARLYQDDTLGFCEDMNMAANKYFNLQASLLFNDVCCKNVDTLYFNKNMQPAMPDDFRYYEEIKVPKYDDNTIGIFHDVKVKKAKFDTEYGRDQSNLGKNFQQGHTIVSNTGETTNIVGVYEENDSVRKYLISTNPPSITNLTKYNLAKNSMKKIFKNNYYHLKPEKNVDLTIYFELFLNTNGEILNAHIIGTYPEIDFKAFENSLNKDIFEFVKQYPSIKPAFFKGKPVNFIALDSVTY